MVIPKINKVAVLQKGTDKLLAVVLMHEGRDEGKWPTNGFAGFCTVSPKLHDLRPATNEDVQRAFEQKLDWPEERYIEVPAEALRKVLEALYGSSYLNREFEAPQSLEELGVSVASRDTINVLVSRYNNWVEKLNAEKEVAADRQARDLTRAQEVESEMKKED